MLRCEEQASQQGHRYIAGVDEAGRGPLAGPVVAAAVCFDWPRLRNQLPGSLDGLTDSKQLSPKRRDRFFDLLHDHPHLRIGIGICTPEEIDRLNILRATHTAMARALEALDPPPDFALVDGLPVKGLPVPHRAIVRGDAQSLAIAAASVIAKVTRDRHMLDLATQYPHYGFERHKGYATRAHRDALERYGPCPVHRKTFAPVAQRILHFPS